MAGRTIRDRQLAMLATFTNDILLAGGAVQGPFPVPVRLTPDLHPGQGPLAGLEAALTYARDEITALIACDMPCVSAALMTHLLSVAADVDVVVPRTESGYHPLCAVYRRTCLPVVSKRLAGGHLAMKDLFTDVRVREVTGQELAALGDPNRLLANVNTPAEHDKLESLLTHEL